MARFDREARSKSKSKTRHRYTWWLVYHKSTARFSSTGKWGYGDAAAGQIQSTYPRETYDRNFIKRGGEGGGRKELSSRQRFQRDNSRDFHPLSPFVSLNCIPNRIVEGFLSSRIARCRTSIPFRFIARTRPFHKGGLIDLISSDDRAISVAGHRLDNLSPSLFLSTLVTPRVPCKIHSPFITIMTLLRSLCSPAESFMPSRGTTFVECSSATVRLTCISRGNLPSLKRTQVAFHGTGKLRNTRSALLSFFHLCFHPRCWSKPR